MPLTATQIKNAKPGPKIVRMYDERWLYLEVSPAGGKWWRLKYRFRGREKRLSLGVYPDVNLKAAREHRDEARKLLADGIDPSASRKALRSAGMNRTANSFEVVAREWIAKQSLTWSPNHVGRLIRRLERNIFPWIGGQPIADVTAPELLDALRRIESRGAVATAIRALGNCSQVFGYAIATGRAERNVPNDLRGALSSAKKGHFASVTEPQQVASVLRAIDGYEGTMVVQCALRLAPLVFVCSPSEHFGQKPLKN